MKYETNEVSPTISELRMHVIPDCPTNAYVIRTKKAAYVIDTGFGSASAAELRNCLGAAEQVFVINTHHHWDHVWGNAYFGKAQIVCHEECRTKTAARWDEMIARNRRYIDGETEYREASLVFDSRLELNDELLLFHAPGHSPDCIGIYYPAEESLFVGDNFGDNDEELIPSLDCERKEFLASLELFKSFDPAVFYSGHNVAKGRGIIEQMLKLL